MNLSNRSLDPSRPEPRTYHFRVVTPVRIFGANRLLKVRYDTACEKVLSYPQHLMSSTTDRKKVNCPTCIEIITYQ